MKRRIYDCIAGLLLCAATAAQPVRYQTEDSIAVIHCLRECGTSRTMPCAVGETMLCTARHFINTPYIAATLETEGEEQLIVNVDSVDCTTFVEYVLAASLSLRQEEGRFVDFCRRLRQIRYRDGCCNGYTSRLHYFSDWIRDNREKGLIREVGGDCFERRQSLTLDFMSTHPEAYPALREHPERVEEIRRIERSFYTDTVRYIPKHLLDMSSDELPVRNGDIIALVTSLKGLDVSHVGIAVWKGKKLHLLHASSVAGRVISDSLSLFSYMAKRKSLLGIRVIRAAFE